MSPTEDSTVEQSTTSIFNELKGHNQNVYKGC